MGHYTLSRLKYFNTTKLVCTNCPICWLSAKFGSKKEIEICKYNKYDVSYLILSDAQLLKALSFDAKRGSIFILGVTCNRAYGILGY